MACYCPVTEWYDCHLCYDCSITDKCPYGFTPSENDKKNCHEIRLKYSKKQE